MAIPFSETTRSLNADKNTFISLWLVFSALILFLWGAWFFAGSIYHYVGSQRVTITKEPHPTWRLDDNKGLVKPYHRYLVETQFDKEDLSLIHPGQRISIHTDNSSATSQSPYSSLIEKVDQKSGLVQTILEIPADKPPQLTGLSTRAEVTVSQQTPAAFMFHIVSRENKNP
ncbi:MAG: hypothetical protein HQL69_03160 [Magnetococcales bacterium]|nr:hypothetical protein [Magnetococcales bacterium]